jgi:hypothetical protein
MPSDPAQSTTPARTNRGTEGIASESSVEVSIGGGCFGQRVIQLVLVYRLAGQPSPVPHNSLWVSPGRYFCLQGAVGLGFLPVSPNVVTSSFVEGQNGWKPQWASDSHAIGVAAV